MRHNTFFCVFDIVGLSRCKKEILKYSSERLLGMIKTINTSFFSEQNYVKYSPRNKKYSFSHFALLNEKTQLTTDRRATRLVTSNAIYESY